MDNPTCNSGHSDYPLRLWDCPVCVAKKLALLEDVVEAAKDLRTVVPSSSFWQIKDHDKSWIWCWNELSDLAQQRVKQANICFGNALAKLEKQL